jgi:hypothetical protein
LQPFEESDLVPDFKHAHNRKEVMNLPLNCEVHFDEKVVKVFADQALDPRYATRHNIGEFSFMSMTNSANILDESQAREILIDFPF